jgi:hypothetical protein
MRATKTGNFRNRPPGALSTGRSLGRLPKSWSDRIDLLLGGRWGVVKLWGDRGFRLGVVGKRLALDETHFDDDRNAGAAGKSTRHPMKDVWAT